MTILDRYLQERQSHVPESLSDLIAIRFALRLKVPDLAFDFMRVARRRTPEEMFVLFRRAVAGGRSRSLRDIAETFLSLHTTFHP